MSLHVATRRALLQSAAAASSAGNWWDIDGQTVVAAYQPIGADDLADSYINLANPGTNDAAPGVAPTWAAGTGWTFNGSTQYLNTSVVPDTYNRDWSMLIRYSDHDGTTETTLAGYYSNAGADDSAFSIQFNASGMQVRNGYKTNGIINSPLLVTGVYGFAEITAYRDGAAESNTMGTIGDTNIYPIYIGALRIDGGGGSEFASVNIQAFAIYSTTLSAADVSTLTTAMNALS